MMNGIIKEYAMKKKKILSIILIILIVLICVSSFIAIQYSKNNSKTDVNGNNENNSEELKNIEGKYSDIKITDTKTALSSLENVKDDINIKNINMKRKYCHGILYKFSGCISK